MSCPVGAGHDGYITDNSRKSINLYRVHPKNAYICLSIELSRSTSVAKSSRRQSFFAALPDEFDRQDYLEAAERTGVPSSTAEKWIRTFCDDDGPLEKLDHNRYRKNV